MTRWLQVFTAVFVLNLSLGCASNQPVSWREAARQAHPWGYYTGVPMTEWNPDGRSMTLLREFRYTDPQGKVWVAPLKLP